MIFFILEQSWINFWIDINAAPARTSLGVTTVLTITQQAQTAANEVPKLSYVKGDFKQKI